MRITDFPWFKEEIDHPRVQFLRFDISLKDRLVEVQIDDQRSKNALQVGSYWIIILGIKPSNSKRNKQISKVL